MNGLLLHTSNGRVSCKKLQGNKRIVHVLAQSNYWSSAENNANNAWNVNFNTSSSNVNNNNKYNTNNVVRAVAALGYGQLESVIEAYRDCCKHKMGSADCVEFRMHTEYLLILAYQIYYRCYVPSQSKTFIVTYPKLREIFAAAFCDRIVQHWIVIRVNPYFEQRHRALGNVSFNCRKGFGTLAARERLYHDMHKNGFYSSLYLGKYDISSCFMSIDKDSLWFRIQRFLIWFYYEDDLDLLLYVIKITIYHRPQDNCIRTGDLSLWVLLPKHKSLFYCNGLPIGNITTQIFYNFYMSFFDEWMLRRIFSLGYFRPWEHYIRFVDDFSNHGMLLVHIKQLRVEATQVLLTEFHFKLHPDKIYIQPQRHGIQFVGGVVLEGRTYLLNRTISSFVQSLFLINIICDKIINNGIDSKYLYELEHAVQSINSYQGFLVHCASYNLQKKFLYPLSSFWKVCYTKKNLSVVKVKNKYKIKNYLYGKEILFREAEAGTT